MTFRNEFLIDEDVYTVEILSLSDEMVMMVNGKRYQISQTTTDSSATLKINNNLYKTYAADTKNNAFLKVESETYRLEKKKNTDATQSLLSKIPMRTQNLKNLIRLVEAEGLGEGVRRATCGGD